jgi:SAM-dependent methyltransferase
LRTLIEAYYTRYYRDTLGLPDWQLKVLGRFTEEDVEATRIQAVAEALGRPLRGLRVLNVGCGTGGFNVAAERAGAGTWGIDASDDAVRICELRRAIGAGGRYARAAAEALPFSDGAFDVVYCLSTLEHVESVEARRQRITRVLRPGAPCCSTLQTPGRSGWQIAWPHPPAQALACLSPAGRPTGFVDSLNYLRRAAAIVPPGGAANHALRSGQDGLPGLLATLARLYYRTFRVQPAIQLVARKGASARP